MPFQFDLPACSLLQAESLVNDRPSLLKTAATSRVQQALPAEGPRKAGLGIEPTSVRLARATQSAAPSNTPPSRHEVEGSPLSDSSGLASSQDSDVVLSEVERVLAHLRPKDEIRPFVVLPTGRDAFPTTRLKGEEVQKSLCPCPSPSSTKRMRAELVTQGQPRASFHHQRGFSQWEGEAPSSVGKRKTGSGFSPHLPCDTATRCADTRKREARISSSFLAYVTWTEDGFSYPLPSCFL